MKTEEEVERRNGGKAKRAYVSQKEFPRHTLADAVRVAQVIADHYGGEPAEPIDVAESLGLQPSSGHFRTITGAAAAYDLTDGAYNANEIALTDLGRRTVMPTEEGDDHLALREALRKPRVLGEFFGRYDGKKLPPRDIMRNVLLKMGVPSDAVERATSVILDSAQHAGVLREIKGETYVRLGGVSRTAPAGAEEEAEQGQEEPSDAGARAGPEAVVHFARRVPSPTRPGV